MNQTQISNIDMLLEKRYASYPIRDTSWSDLVAGCQLFADELLAKLDAERYVYDKEKIKEIERIIQNPVFICGAMKSGTTLLRGLLDGTIACFSLPGDSHYVNRKRLNKNKDIKKVASHRIPRLINPNANKPYWFLGKDEKTYYTFLAYSKFFLARYEWDSFVCAVGGMLATFPLETLQKITYRVEKTPGNEFVVSELKMKFKNAKFIHIERNPLHNISSLKKLAEIRKQKFNLTKTIAYRYATHIVGGKNKEKLGDAYLEIRYEDLVGDCESTMRNVCKFLGVSFEKKYCTPTSNRKPARSNSMHSGDRVTGTVVNKNKSDNRKKYVTKREIEYIGLLLNKPLSDMKGKPSNKNVKSLIYDYVAKSLAYCYLVGKKILSAF